jgi:hypothetical protein
MELAETHRHMGTRFHGLKVALVALGALGFLALFHPALIQAPGATLFRGSGDGLKNYFVFGYHLKHDSSYMQFEGMNHPFGEQIGYPDAQPALVNAAKLASGLFPALRNESVAIINLAVLVGWLLTAVSIYLLLLYFGVYWAYAAIGGIALMALSPQALRMVAGHHGLTYGWAIVLPVLSYLRVRTGQWPWRAAIGGAVLLLLGIQLHQYTGMIALALLGVLFLLDRPVHTLLGEPQRAKALLLLLCAPVFAYLLIQGLSDHHTGRTDKPLGFFDYRTDRHGILAPYAHYGDPLAQRIVPLDGPADLEASTYLGLAVLLAAAVLFMVASILLLRPTLLREHGTGWPRRLTLLVLAAMVLLAFAVGVPFSSARGWLPWSVPFIGQFRSPGRFGWAAYYMFGIAAIYSAWWLWQQARGMARWPAALYAALIPALYLYQGTYLHTAIAQEIHGDRNVLHPDLLTAEEKALIEAASRTPYRAMVAVPHFLNGSDELLLLPDEPTMRSALTLAYHTGIPLMSSNLARTSVTETFQQLGVFNAPWYPRPIAARFAPDDRILLVRGAEPGSAFEAAHFARAEPLITAGGVELRSIRASELFLDRRAELFAELESTYSDTTRDGGWQVLPSAAPFHFQDHEDRPSPLAYRGKGAYQGVHGEFNVVASVPPGTLQEGEHIASFWVHNKGPLRLHTLVCITQQALDAPQDEWISCGDTRFSRVVNGDWSLFELRFSVDRSQDHFGIKLKGADHYRDTITVDEVLIRPADALVFRVLERDAQGIRAVHYNGHYLQRP